LAGRDIDVTVTTISGGNSGSLSSLTLIDVPVTLTQPPAYDTLSPLYDDKDLPKYCEVVAAEGTQLPVNEPPPPSYDSEPTSTCSTQQPECTSSVPISNATEPFSVQ